MEAMLNEYSFLARRRSTGSRNKRVEFIEISLGQITSAHGIVVFNLDRDDTALLVIRNFRHAGEMFGRIDVVALVIDVLEVKALDKMAAHGPALQQIDEERSRGVLTEKPACKAAERAQAAPTSGERGQEHRTGTLLLGRHNASHGCVLFGNDESNAKARD